MGRVAPYKLGAALACLLALCAGTAQPTPSGRDEAEDRAIARMSDHSLPTATRYFEALEVVRRYPEVLEDKQGLFAQLFSNMETFVGDYESADKHYVRNQRFPDPIAGGFINASESSIALLPLTASRRAVFFNESHARADTRAAVLRLLQPMREQGFANLALEGLSTVPSTADGCFNSVAADAGLGLRGHAVARSGYYTNEPVFAELIRTALALGYSVHGYETAGSPDESQGEREDGMASNLACIFQQEPKARLVVIAGFGHLSESEKNSGVEGGAMAYRFRMKTGIDPLTIDTTALLHAENTRFKYNLVAGLPAGSDSFVLTDDGGRLFGLPEKGYDISLLIPGAGSRNAPGANWLALGTLRVSTYVDGKGCQGTRPCLIESLAQTEQLDGIARDRCVLRDESAKACQLFLTRGEHRIRFLDARQRLLGSSSVLVN